MSPAKLNNFLQERWEHWREIARGLRQEMRKLKDQLRSVERSRARWKREAKINANKLRQAEERIAELESTQKKR
ncbi:MAG: hypothetical protein J5I94_16940 [Phaeodactylibacter sp.]|nr:hypothetical protein [Phaeodactylibacter sp.]